MAPAVLPPTSRFVRVPGACVSSACTPLRLVGISSRVSRVNAVFGVVETTSMTGEVPETVIVSLSAPTFSATSSLAVKPAVRRMSSRRTD
jgi:hypothetical protein